MFFGGSPFEQFAGMHGGEGGGGGGGRRGGPPADVDTTELYQILGIEKDATENDIKKAYRKLALKVRALRSTTFIRGRGVNFSCCYWCFCGEALISVFPFLFGAEKVELRLLPAAIEKNVAGFPAGPLLSSPKKQHSQLSSLCFFVEFLRDCADTYIRTIEVAPTPPCWRKAPKPAPTLFLLFSNVRAFPTYTTGWFLKISVNSFSGKIAATNTQVVHSSTSPPCLRLCGTPAQRTELSPRLPSLALAN